MRTSILLVLAALGLSAFADKTASQEWVLRQNYVTKTVTNGLATTAYVEEHTPGNYETVSNKAMTALQSADISDMATKTWVGGREFVAGFDMEVTVDSSSEKDPAASVTIESSVAEGKKSVKPKLSLTIPKPVNVEVVDTVTSTATDKALSANMGRSLQEEISNLQQRGRYLSVWDCSQGKALTAPLNLPYDYKSGDYFIVGITTNTTNYRPFGDQYTSEPASAPETQEVKVNDTYYFDGNTWTLLASEQKAVTFGSLTGNIDDNDALHNAFESTNDYRRITSKIAWSDVEGSPAFVTETITNGLVEVATNSAKTYADTKFIPYFNGGINLELTGGNFKVDNSTRSVILGPSTATSTGKNAIVAGNNIHALADYTVAIGQYAEATDAKSVVINLEANRQKKYYSHGIGTFNVKPVGGVAGFYIGDDTFETVVTNIIGKVSVDKSITNGLATITYVDKHTPYDYANVSNKAMTALQEHQSLDDYYKLDGSRKITGSLEFKEGDGYSAASIWTEAGGLCIDAGYYTDPPTDVRRVIAFSANSKTSSLYPDTSDVITSNKLNSVLEEYNYVPFTNNGVVITGKNDTAFRVVNTDNGKSADGVSVIIGNATHTPGRGSLSVGINSEARAIGSFAAGASTKASGLYSTALGGGAEASHTYSFAWSGSTGSTYTSKAAGAFCVNPVGGVDGFYIGSSKLSALFATQSYVSSNYLNIDSGGTVWNTVAMPELAIGKNMTYPGRIDFYGGAATLGVSLWHESTTSVSFSTGGVRPVNKTVLTPDGTPVVTSNMLNNVADVKISTATSEVYRASKKYTDDSVVAAIGMTPEMVTNTSDFVSKRNIPFKLQPVSTATSTLSDHVFYSYNITGPITINFMSAQASNSTVRRSVAVYFTCAMDTPPQVTWSKDIAHTWLLSEQMEGETVAPIKGDKIIYFDEIAPNKWMVQPVKLNAMQ